MATSADQPAAITTAASCLVNWLPIEYSPTPKNFADAHAGTPHRRPRGDPLGIGEFDVESLRAPKIIREPAEQNRQFESHDNERGPGMLGPSANVERIGDHGDPVLKQA